MENLCQVEDVQEMKGVLDPLAPTLQNAEKQNFVNQVRESPYQICVLMIISNLQHFHERNYLKLLSLSSSAHYVTYNG